MHSTPIVAINYDAGETVGWPRLASTVADVQREHPGSQVITQNYGEYGAVARYQPSVPVFSGHNSLWSLARPSADTVVVIGYERSELVRWFAMCQLAATIDNGVGLDNDEQDEQVFVCRGPDGGWPALWPRLRRLG